MILEIEAPDGKTYEIDAPEGVSPKEAVDRFKQKMWPNLASDTGLRGALNTADIAGAGVGAAIAGPAELARTVMGPPPALGQKLYSEFWKGQPPKSAKEAIGRFMPTDPAARAKKLGIPLTPNREALARGAEFAAGTLAFGGPAKMAALAGVGGAAGQRVAGDEGAVALGLALPLAGIRASAPKIAKAPSVEEVSAARKAAYSTADNSGAVVSQGSLGRMLQDMHAEMAPKYFAKDTHPQAFKAFRELTEEATKGHVELGRLFKMRGRMGALKGASGTAGQDADMIRTMRSVMDRHIVNMQPVRDIIAGDAKAIKAFREGTSLFRREQGMKTIEKLIENAKTNAPTYTAAGFDTALRNQFKALVKNDRQMRFFTKPEQEALTKIARGGHVANTLRQLGRFAPQNILYTLLSAHLHPAMLAASGAGAGARMTATGLTKRNVKLAKDLLARGYPVPPNLRRYLDAAPAAAGVFASQVLQTR